MPGESLIAIRNVYKRYGRKRVLRGVDLDIGEGQVMALLGSNGAGKTTLMRIVAGLSKPDRGEVLLGGASAENAGHELRRYIGLVSHKPLLYDNLSAIENLSFFARMYDIQQPEARIETVLNDVNLWARRRDPVRTYSRGMVQRMAIARAILHDPPILLLDEPDTGLDQDSAETLHNLIRSLGAAKRAILLSTHNLDRALAWGDSVCFLVDGTIAFREDSTQLTGQSLHSRYAELSQAS